jgi:hypothetical protein
VQAHLADEDDRLVSVRPVLDRGPTFRDLLLEDCEEKFISLREAEGIGRPLGTGGFVTELGSNSPTAYPLQRISDDISDGE